MHNPNPSKYKYKYIYIYTYIYYIFYSFKNIFIKIEISSFSLLQDIPQCRIHKILKQIVMQQNHLLVLKVTNLFC